MALPAEATRYTFADVLTWSEKDRIEIIGGKAFMMFPPLRVHQEILMALSWRHDLAVKYRLYQRAGVREYWIVDPDGKTVQVFRLEDGLYNAPDVFMEGSVVLVGIWEDFSIDLSKVFTE